MAEERSADRIVALASFRAAVIMAETMHFAGYPARASRWVRDQIHSARLAVRAGIETYRRASAQASLQRWDEAVLKALDEREIRLLAWPAKRGSRP